MQTKKSRLKRIVLKLGALYPIDPSSYLKGMEICRTLHNHGVCTTLGKFSKEGDSPEAIVHEYRQCSALLRKESATNGFYLSLKPPGLEFDTEHIKNIAAVALRNGHGIHFDSHYHFMAEPTLQLLEDTMMNCGSIYESNEKWHWGLTLPSRWKRSLEDIRWAIKKGVRIRLVKGEFKAARSSDEMNAEKGFLELVDSMTGLVAEIAIATHDHELAKEAIARARKKGTKVQLELLFGMPVGKMIALSKEMNVPVRFYVPYGDTLLLYGIRHFVTNPHKLLRPKLQELFGGVDSKLYKIVTSL